MLVSDSAKSETSKRISVNDNQYEDILSYDEIIDHIEQDTQNDFVWK